MLVSFDIVADFGAVIQLGVRGRLCPHAKEAKIFHLSLMKAYIT